MADKRINMAVFKNDIEYMKKELAHINKKLDKKYVTRFEFEPVKKVVYGLVALILASVVSGLIGILIL